MAVTQTPLRKQETQLASQGSLASGVLADLVALRNFLDGRDRALERLIGRKLTRSYLRDELIRVIVIDFGFSRRLAVTHYQKSCAYLGSVSAVLGELHLLSDCGLILFLPGERNRKVQLVGPTQKLVDWYSGQLPLLMDQAKEFLLAREISR